MLLREKRKARKFTQKYIAECLGITQQAYWLIENGQRRITLERAKKLAEIFGCTIDELFYSEK